MKNLLRRFLWWFAGITGIWKFKLNEINNEPVLSLTTIHDDYMAIIDAIDNLNLMGNRIQDTLSYRISYVILCTIKYLKKKQNKGDGWVMVPTIDPAELKENIENLGIEVIYENNTYRNPKVARIMMGISIWSLNIDQQNKERLELLNIIINHPPL